MPARLQVLQRSPSSARFQVASHDPRSAAPAISSRAASGQIAAVGFDMYVKILEEAVPS